MLSSNELLERVGRSRKNYADRVEQSAAALEQHDVYKAMADYTLLAHGEIQRRFVLPVSRPFVQIDIGSGSGRMLGAIAAQCREESRRCLLIGVEVNELLARASAQRLREQGFAVAEHIHGKESVEQKPRQAPVLRRRYSVREEAIEGMDLSFDQQIVLVQDDARNDMQVLAAVLKKARSQGISHVDQISWAFPGVSGDLAMQNSPDVEELGHDALLMRESSGLVAGIVAGTTRLAYQTLKYGGLLTLFQRLAKGAPLERMYELIAGTPFPADECGSLQARMLLVQGMVLGVQAEKFNPKMGAVIIPDLHIAEASTTLDYAGMIQNDGARKSAVLRATERDLFALSMVRSDLHVMGNTGALLQSKERRGVEGDHT